MARPQRRIPMFFKFLAGCLLLAFLLITGGAIVVHIETRLAHQGNDLGRHFERYLTYQSGQGRAVRSVAELVANEPRLRQSLSSPVDDVAGRRVAVEITDAAFAILSHQDNLDLDLAILFDDAGSLLWASPQHHVDARELTEMVAVAQVRDGLTYYDQILIHRGRAYQVAGIPIRRLDSAAIVPPTQERLAGVVGGLILGIDVSRYMEAYKQHSDPREPFQHRMVLLHEGEVVTASMSDDLWPELTQQLDRNNWSHLDEFRGFKQPVAHLSVGDYDLAVRDVSGFARLKSGQVGEMFLLRSRADAFRRRPKVPWNEVLIGVGLSVLIAMILANWITRPIKAFVQRSQEILEGETDLTQRITLRSRDETQDLADNINQVFERLYELAYEVQNAAFQVGASSAEISAASKQMLQGLKDQTLKIEGSTAAVTELSASIQQVASNAAEATKTAEKSNVSVTAAVERMQQIRGAVDEAGSKIGDLGESSKRIGNIVEVIRQISEQTSLLALNASIEAAHAGEQGRGFAVVADEVSSLARRVGQSAKDIEALIQTIREQTGEAVRAMQVGTREVEGGTALVTTTLTDLTTLINVVKDSSAAVQEQAVVSDEIARNMDAVQSIASEMLASSAESVTQAEQLHELAFMLEQSVGGFNLDGGQRSAALPNTRARLPAALGISEDHDQTSTEAAPGRTTSARRSRGRLGPGK